MLSLSVTYQIGSSGKENDDFEVLSARINEESSKFGSVERFIANLVFVGLPGSGKTTLIANLLQKLDRVKELLKASASTDILDKIKHVEKSMASTTQEDECSEIEEYSALMEIAKCIKNLPSKKKNTKIHEDEKSKSDDSKTEGGTGSEEQLNPGDSLSKKTITKKARKTVLTQEQYLKLRPHLNNRFSLYICDTGGQLELQELLPLFIAGPLIFIFVFPFHRSGLDFHTEVSFRDIVDGNTQHMNKYKASSSVEDLLRQTLSSVKSSRLNLPSNTLITRKECEPHIFLVGTHKDELVNDFIVCKKLKNLLNVDSLSESKLKIKHEKKEYINDYDQRKFVKIECSETEHKEVQEEVDKYMKNLDLKISAISSGFGVVPATQQGEETIFFQVNNSVKCTDETTNFVAVDYDEKKFVFQIVEDMVNQTEHDVFRRIRSGVNSWISSNDTQFKINDYPLNYLLASLRLSEKSAYCISKDQFADDLKLEGIEISSSSNKKRGMEDLLYFLHHVTGQIRYYPKVAEMENIIINQPQVCYKLLTRLIVNKKGLDDDQCKEFNKGFFTFEHFKRGIEYKLKKEANQEKQEEETCLLTPNRFFGILRRLCILTTLNCEYDDEVISDSTMLFMPCKINQAEERKVEKGKYQESFNPLAIQFDCKHCPKGLFGFLVYFVMQSAVHGKWTLKKSKVFRNCVSFAINDDGDYITLTFCSSHILVQFFQYNETTTMDISIVKEHCIRARKKLNSALKQAIDHLRYDRSKVNHMFVFVYDCCKESYSPPNLDDQSKRNTFSLICCCKADRMKKDAEIWLGGE